MNKIAKWTVILLTASLIGVGVSALVDQYTYQNSGSITTIGVTVTDINGNPVTLLDWGAVENGTAYVWEPLNVTNISNVNANLTLSTANHSASIISLTLTWNYTGAVLQPNDSVIVELTQTITATGDWSYDTIIEAIGAEE